MRLFLATMAVSAAVLTSSCAREARARGPEGWPAVLRFNLALGTDDASWDKRADLIHGYLEKQLGIPVEVTKSVGYGGVIEAMRAKKIEAATLGSFAYLIASEKAGAEAIATRGTADGTPGDYAGTFAVPVDSPLQSWDDVVRRSHELTLSFVDPASTSGYLVQRAFLESSGIDPEKAFKRVTFTNSHISSAMTLLGKKVDVAAISENTIQTLADKGKLQMGQIRVLWKSPRIPNAPVTVRRDLPTDFKRKLQDAFVNMEKIAPDVYQGTRTSSVARTLVYVRASDATFDPLRALARGMKNLQLFEQ